MDDDSFTISDLLFIGKLYYCLAIISMVICIIVYTYNWVTIGNIFFLIGSGLFIAGYYYAFGVLTSKDWKSTLEERRMKRMTK